MIKKLFTNKDLDLSKLFIIMSVVGLMSTIIVLYATRGDAFSKIFFYDTLDTGMDFFHSMEYVRGRTPYRNFNTLYPPLANLFFYLLYLLVPSWQRQLWPKTFSEGVQLRGTYNDYRHWQPTMLIFIVFIMVITLLIFYMIKRILKDNKYSSLVAICCIFSNGVMLSIERGNIILISFVLTLFFLEYYNDDNRIVSELALIALAIAAGLKIYPALFGMMLIYDKQYKKAIRTIIYGIIFFVLPFFAFEEGIGGLSYFLKSLIGFGGSSSNGSITITGLSFDKILFTFITIIKDIFNSNIIDLTKINGTVLNVIASLLVLLIGFILKKRWGKILCCTLAMILFTSQALYITVFLIIPLCFR